MVNNKQLVVVLHDASIYCKFKYNWSVPKYGRNNILSLSHKNNDGGLICSALWYSAHASLVISNHKLSYLINFKNKTWN